MKLVHWPLIGELLHFVQRGRDSLYQNVTAHLSTASVPITVLLYNGPLLSDSNVPIKGLNQMDEAFLRIMLSQDICLSVCLSHAGIESTRLNISSNCFTIG